MGSLRKSLQGTLNIVRFNVHIYFASLVLALLMAFCVFKVPSAWQMWFVVAALLVSLATLASLVVSAYVYDCSNLYQMPWMKEIRWLKDSRLVNIHAGYDEFSCLIKEFCPACRLEVFDFYDSANHTELSIRRARQLSAQHPDTIKVSTNGLPLNTGMADVVFVMFAAHEIRDREEQLQFFRELKRVLSPGGQIVVTEHLRDLPNFLAYSLGFFHFHSRRRWCSCFAGAGLSLSKEMKTTPFVTTFILEHDRATF